MTYDGKPAASLNEMRELRAIVDKGAFKKHITTEQDGRFTRVFYKGKQVASLDDDRVLRADSLKALDRNIADEQKRADALPAGERFAVGRSLTPAQRRDVLGTLVDVYKKKGAPREQKGVDANGNERFGYAHSPDLFETSDITGAAIRYYVQLPDGRIAHPSELFPDYSQTDIDKALAAQQDEDNRKAANAASRSKTLQSRRADSLAGANRVFNTQNPGPRTYTPATLSDGKQYVRTAPETADEDAKLLGDGWGVVNRGEHRDGGALKTYSPADLQARQDAIDEAERQQAKDDAQAERKAKADAQRDEFTLTGSDRAADANPNQGGLFSQSGDNAGNQRTQDGQKQPANGIPRGLRAERNKDSDRLEQIIDRQLERDGQPTGFKALAIGKDQLPDALRGALAAIERVTGNRVVIFRNLTPGVADFNGVTVRDGVIYISETSDNPATSTAAHEWVHNLRKTNPGLYKLLADEVIRQGDAYGFAKEYGYGLSEAAEELTAAAVGDALTDGLEVDEPG